MNSLPDIILSPTTSSPKSPNISLRILFSNK